jgi:hypothetical protein
MGCCIHPLRWRETATTKEGPVQFARDPLPGKIQLKSSSTLRVGNTNCAPSCGMAGILAQAVEIGQWLTAENTVPLKNIRPCKLHSA